MYRAPRGIKHFLKYNKSYFFCKQQKNKLCMLLQHIKANLQQEHPGMRVCMTKKIFNVSVHRFYAGMKIAAC